MSVKTFLKDINLSNQDKKYLIVLLCFSISLTFILMKFHMGRGAFSSDVSVYLAGALDFAGMNVNLISDPTWIQNSPFIIFLTSLLFRLGYVNAYAIIYVGGFFGIMGIFGLYIFLRKVFNPLLSLTGAILYSSFSLTLFYYANGMLDIPAVAMIIWTLIFTVAAVDKNPKYYILVAISFILSFYTRFATAFILALIVLYMLKNHDVINLIECLFYDRSVFKQRIFSFLKSDELKWILISIFIGFLIFLFVYEILLSFNIDVGYFTMAQGSVSGYVEKSVANISDKKYYIYHFLSLLSTNSITYPMLFTEQYNQPSILSYLTIIIVFFGIALKIINYLKNINIFKEYYVKLEFRNNLSKILLILSIIVLFVVARVGFKFNYLITLICFWIIFIILMSLIREYPIDKDKFSFSIMCIGLFSFYFIVVSFINIKCYRYILPAFPGFVYLVIYSLDSISEVICTGFDSTSFKNRLNKKDIECKSTFRHRISKLLPIILIIICLFFAFNFTNTVEVNENGVEIIELCDYIKEYDPNYQSKDILSVWEIRYFEWYLNKDIDKLYEDVNAIDSKKYDYIISFKEPLNDKNYKEVHHIGYYYLNEKR